MPIAIIDETINIKEKKIRAPIAQFAGFASHVIKLISTKVKIKDISIIFAYFIFIVLIL